MQPEPDPKYRTCNTCGRKDGVKGKFIPLPQEYGGGFWYYLCRWHRAWETRRKRLTLKI